MVDGEASEGSPGAGSAGVVIDVHGHLMPEPVFDQVPPEIAVLRRGDAEPGSGDATDKALVVGGVRGRFAPAMLREVEVRQRAQKARGIEISVVGPWLDMVKAAPTVAVQERWCRTLTDALCKTAEQREDLRFVAALPDLDGGAAADELARAVDLGAVGGLLAANPRVDGLDAAHYDRLWQVAEQLRVPLVVHPGYFQPPEHMKSAFYLANAVGNPFETTMAVGRLIGADVPGRFPALALVLVHGGGYYPYQFGRLDAAFARWPANAASARRLPSDLLGWFYYDTVLFEEQPMRYLVDLVGHERILGGTDCPFMMADYRAFEVPESLGLGADERAAVLGGNAARLFGITV